MENVAVGMWSLSKRLHTALLQFHYKSKIRKLNITLYKAIKADLLLAEKTAQNGGDYDSSLAVSVLNKTSAFQLLHLHTQLYLQNSLSLISCLFRDASLGDTYASYYQ